MLTKEDILSIELAQDVILVKGKIEIKRASGLIISDKTADMADFSSFDYEVVKIHDKCFKQGDFTSSLPQVGDKVIVSKYDARKIFQDPEEFEENGIIYRVTYYVIKDTNVQAFVKQPKKGE